NVKERIGRTDVGDDGDQMRRILTRRPPLHPTQVRTSYHSNFAIAPALPRKPFDRVVAVLGLMDKGFPHARRAEPSTAILNGDGVTSASMVETLQLHDLFLVGRANQD